MANADGVITSDVIEFLPLDGSLPCRHQPLSVVKFMDVTANHYMEIHGREQYQLKSLRISGPVLGWN